jgi:phospholipid-binding lipoprotein MlaA
MTASARPPVPARKAAFRVGAAALLLVTLTGCTTLPDAHPRDPLEPFNRGVYGFNDAVDRALFKPVATLYRDVTPVVIRNGVSNFFGNLEDAWSSINSLLQAKPQAAGSNFMRFSVNTLMGLGGVLDVAGSMRIERQREDFGQTLGWWGVPSGPYLVLPFLGPSTLRDTAAMPVDSRGDYFTYMNHIPTRNQVKVLDFVDTRTGLLSVSSALDEVALDRYSFTRDAFLQRRANAVFDGNPPEELTGGKMTP